MTKPLSLPEVDDTELGEQGGHRGLRSGGSAQTRILSRANPGEAGPGCTVADRAGGRDPAMTLVGCRRIVVLGRTGSGKTTLARQLAGRLGVSHIELDALHFGPNWTPVPTALLRERAAAATAGDRWVADGNKSAVRDIVWPRADTIVWLDYSLAVSCWRLMRRALVRGVTLTRWALRRGVTKEADPATTDSRGEGWKEAVSSGTRESLWAQFLAAANRSLGALQSHGRQRREYPAQFARPEHVHLAVVHLRSPRAARHWLARVTAERAAIGTRLGARSAAPDH